MPFFCSRNGGHMKKDIRNHSIKLSLNKEEVDLLQALKERIPEQKEATICRNIVMNIARSKKFDFLADKNFSKRLDEDSELKLAAMELSLKYSEDINELKDEKDEK